MEGNKAINFIRYNNAVPIAISLVVFMTAGAMAASPEIRENVKESFVDSDETVESVDNTLLLATNMEDFDFDLRILNVMEDEDNYYVDYSFNTFLLEDSIWRIMPKAGSLEVPIQALGGRDLGDYVAEELKELIDYEKSYLADTQKLEERNGATQKVVTKTYSGLIGKYLDPKEIIFEGYERVIKEEKMAKGEVLPGNSDLSASAGSGFTEDHIKALVENMIKAKMSTNYYDPTLAVGSTTTIDIIADDAFDVDPDDLEIVEEVDVADDLQPVNEGSGETVADTETNSSGIDISSGEGVTDEDPVDGGGVNDDQAGGATDTPSLPISDTSISDTPMEGGVDGETSGLDQPAEALLDDAKTSEIVADETIDDMNTATE